MIALAALAGVARQQGEGISLPVRYPVPVRAVHAIRVASVHTGDTLRLAVAQDLRSGDCMMFREGAPVAAVVSQVRKAGAIGMSSLIVLEVVSTRAADGTYVPLHGTLRAEGEDRAIESLGAASMCCLGIFLPGGTKHVGKGIGTLALTTQEIAVKCPET